MVSFLLDSLLDQDRIVVFVKYLEEQKVRVGTGEIKILNNLVF